MHNKELRTIVTKLKGGDVQPPVILELSMVVVRLGETVRILYMPRRRAEPVEVPADEAREEVRKGRRCARNGLVEFDRDHFEVEAHHVHDVLANLRAKGGFTEAAGLDDEALTSVFSRFPARPVALYPYA